MIGNDIVDLNLSISETNWRRKGYLQKIFSPGEQDVILNSKNPEQDLWIFWAMKEATYKAHQRRFNLARRYNPRLFRCEISGTKGTLISGIVKVGEYLYYTTTSVNEDYLHCISSAGKYQKSLIKMVEDPAKLKSALIAEISALRNLPLKGIVLVKNEHFIPQLSYGNKIQEENFSLSHHGKFSAFTVALMNY